MEKPHLKSYQKDGAHAHTEESPIGEHNHPEIEKEISRLWDYQYELSSRISKLENPVVKESTMLSNKGKNAELKADGGNKMTDEPVKPAEVVAPAPAAPVTPPTEPAKPAEPVEPAKPDEGTDEIKSLKGELAQLKSINAETQKQLAELKAILDQPQLKAMQEPKIPETTPMDNITPLGLIR